MPSFVRTILSRKGWGAISVAPNNTLLEVVTTLDSNHIGAVTVLDDEHKLLGLVSERDIVNGLADHHTDIASLTAADIMSRDIQTCSPDCTIDEAMQLMTTYRYRHIPILEEDNLLGLVSIGDVVKYRLEEAELFVEEMRAYVMQADPTPEPGPSSFPAH